MSDKWLSELRERMEEHREPAPEGLWDDIARRMEQAVEPAAVAPQRRVVPLWLERMAVAASLAVVLALGYGRLFRDAAHPQSPVAEVADNMVQRVKVPVEALIAQADTAAQVEEPIAEAASSSVAVLAAAAPRPALRAMGPTAKRDVATAARYDTAAGDSVADECTVAEAEAAPEPQQAKAGSRAKSVAARENTGARERRRAASSRGLETGFFASGLAGASNSHTSQNGGVMVSAAHYRGPDDAGDPMSDPITAIVLYNRNNPVQTEIRHRQPIRVGVALRYPLTSRTGIGSGVTYSLLRSSVRSGGEECYYDEERTLHYIGIPLDVTWTVWSNRRLALYLSGGAMVEKCVAGRTRTDYVLRSERRVQRGTIGVDPLQWSVGVAAGLQVELSPRVGLYAEPGVRYYFDNGSDVETLYRDRPLNFSLNVGVRISFR